VFGDGYFGVVAGGGLFFWESHLSSPSPLPPLSPLFFCLSVPLESRDGYGEYLEFSGIGYKWSTCVAIGGILLIVGLRLTPDKFM